MNMSGMPKKNICYFSARCLWSKRFIEAIVNTPYKDEFQYVLVDDPANRPTWLKKVPTLVIFGDEKYPEPLTDEAVVNWVFERKLRGGGTRPPSVVQSRVPTQAVPNQYTSGNPHIMQPGLQIAPPTYQQNRAPVVQSRTPQPPAQPNYSQPAYNQPTYQPAYQPTHVPPAASQYAPPQYQNTLPTPANIQPMPHPPRNDDNGNNDEIQPWVSSEMSGTSRLAYSGMFDENDSTLMSKQGNFADLNGNSSVDVRATSSIGPSVNEVNSRSRGEQLFDKRMEEFMKNRGAEVPMAAPRQ